MNKKIVMAISLILVASIVVVVSAIPLNWFEVAEVTGVIVKSETGTIKAIVDLGTISSASNFSASGSGTITVAEAEELNVTKLLMAVPLPNPKTYLQERFFSLYLNLTIDSNTWNLTIVSNGALKTSFWAPISDEGGYRYYLFTGSFTFPPYRYYYLPQGTHTMVFDVYGKTQIVSNNTNIDIAFLLELSV